MNRKKNYPGIDRFRFIAALLVIAIHTSPLASFSETSDFILTRIIARIAVPFFLMTSGFLMISRYTLNADRLKVFIKKSALIYAAAILIYIPINIYSGYFAMNYLLPNIIKDIVFDGTLYHLWYLPASMLGAVIAWYMVKKMDYPKALTLTVALYIIGLFGDSYYGIAEKVPGLNRFYNLIFQVSDYTRNGIFFAPVFFVLGGIIADNRYHITFVKSISGLAVTFPLMFAEAFVLAHFKLQRHDSMYIFLLPLMFFLFSAILHWNGKCIVWLRTSSLVIYIIHPLVIVAIRLFAKLTGLQDVIVENSIVHYFLVCLISVISGVAATVFWSRYKPRRKQFPDDTARAWIDINLNNLEHNVKVLQRAMQTKSKLMAVVKTEAYGHGAFEISTHLNKMGIKAFAVATIDEAIRLRKYGVRGEILIFGYTGIGRASELKKYNLTQTLIDFAYAKALNKQGIAVKSHIKIDTGMHRLGISCDDLPVVKEIFTMKYIKVCGMYTHLSCADSLLPDDVSFTKVQIDKFYCLIDALKENGITVPKVHIQSSYGLLNYPELKCDYVRVGIALYGVLSTPGSDTILKLDLRPVLSLKTRVVLIRTVGKDEGIGYSRCFTTNRESRIAILPIGYGDGFPRNLSCGKASVIINRQRVPVIGRICMDQLAVDITDAKSVVVGDIATLIGTEGCEELSTPFIADSSNSISNELLCRMGGRLPRLHK